MLSESYTASHHVTSMRRRVVWFYSCSNIFLVLRPKVTDDSYRCGWTNILQFSWNGTMLLTIVVMLHSNFLHLITSSWTVLVTRHSLRHRYVTCLYLPTIIFRFFSDFFYIFIFIFSPISFEFSPNIFKKFLLNFTQNRIEFLYIYLKHLQNFPYFFLSCCVFIKFYNFFSNLNFFLRRGNLSPQKFFIPGYSL